MGLKVKLGNRKKIKINIKNRKTEKFKEDFKGMLKYGVIAFCIANNTSYFLSQKVLVKCWTRNIYQFTKNSAEKIRVFPKKQVIRISTMKKIPKNLANLIKRISK